MMTHGDKTFDIWGGFVQSPRGMPSGLSKGQICFALTLLRDTVQFFPKPPDDAPTQRNPPPPSHPPAAPVFEFWSAGGFKSCFPNSENPPSPGHWCDSWSHRVTRPFRLLSGEPPQHAAVFQEASKNCGADQLLIVKRSWSDLPTTPLSPEDREETMSIITTIDANLTPSLGRKSLFLAQFTKKVQGRACSWGGRAQG